MAAQTPTTQPSGSKKGRKDKKDKRKNSQKDLTELILEDVPLLDSQTGIDVRSRGIARGIDGPYPSMSGGSSNAGNAGTNGHHSHSKQNSSQASSPAVNGRPSLEIPRSSLDTPRSGRSKPEHTTGKSSQRTGASTGQGRNHAYPQASKSSHELRSQYSRTNSDKVLTPGADGMGYPHPRSPHPPSAQLHMPSANSSEAIMQWQMQVPESNSQRSYFDRGFRHPTQEFFQHAVHSSRPMASHPSKNGQQGPHHNGYREYNAGSANSSSPGDILQSPSNTPGSLHDQPRKAHQHFPSADPGRHAYTSFTQTQHAYHPASSDSRDKKVIPRSNRTYFIPSPGEGHACPPDTDAHHYQSAQAGALPYPVSEEDFSAYPSGAGSSGPPVSFFNDAGPHETFSTNDVGHSATVDNMESISRLQNTRNPNALTPSLKPSSVMGPPQLRRASEDSDLRGQKFVNPSILVRSPLLGSRESSLANAQQLPPRPASSVSHYSYHGRPFSGASFSDHETESKAHLSGDEQTKSSHDDHSGRRPSLPDNLSSHRELSDNGRQESSYPQSDNCLPRPSTSDLISPSHYESFDYAATRRPPIKIQVPEENESPAMISHQNEGHSATTPRSASLAHYSDDRRSPPFLSPMRNQASSVSQLSSSSNVNLSQFSPPSSRPKLEEPGQSDGDSINHQPFGPFISNLGTLQKDTAHSVIEDHRAGITRQRRVHGRNSSGGDSSQKGRRPSPYVSPTSSTSQRSPLSEPSTWVLPPDFLTRPSNRHPSHSDERQVPRSLGAGSHQSLHLSKRKVVIMATKDFDNFSVVTLPDIISPRNVRAVLCEKLGLPEVPEAVEISLVEIGQSHCGEVLSDISLQEICLNSDSKGSTKFYVFVPPPDAQETNIYSTGDKTNPTHYDKDTAYPSSLRNPDLSRLPSPGAENHILEDSPSPRSIRAEREPKVRPSKSLATSPRYATSSEDAHHDLSRSAPENNKSDTQEVRRIRPIVPAKPAAFSSTNRHGLLLDTTLNGPDGLRNESFRVIRQPPRREINFDKPRCSPYDETNKTLAAHIDRAAQQEEALNDKIQPAVPEDSGEKSEKLQKPDLVAKRAAPPAPSRSSSLYSANSGKISSPSTLTRSKDSASIQETSLKNKPSQTQPSYGLPPNLVRRTSNRRRRKTPVARKPVPAPSYSLDTPSSSTQIPQPESADDGKPKAVEESEFASESTTEKADQHADMSAFKENEISFDGAPDLTFSQEEDDSSDDGLWAKKPPAQPSSSTSETAQNPSSKESLPSKSPVSPVKPWADKEEKPSTPGSLDGWAVRPSEEDVYENLEKFFPNTDLDKPIPDDVPVNDADGRLLSLPSPVNERSALASKPLASANNARKELDSQGKSDSNKSDIPEVPSVPPPPVPVDTKTLPENRGGASKLSRATRNRSIRIVANEARRKFSKVNEPARTQSTESGGNRDLQRRTSTKLWGQKAVEVTKTGGLRKSHIGSKRVRSSAKAKQFAWVKGELIGKGTFGKVYLALNITTGEMMAVKQVELPKTASDKASERQREVIEAHYAEIETMKDLDHPNIVQYLGYEANEDFHSLFLEYVPGGSVGTCLRRHGHFEESTIRFLTRQVLEGLAYLHSSGILHRDLKADNLLIDRGGLCKISDFGISKRSHDIYANDAGMSMQGTIFWMAPEVINNVIKNEKQGYSAKVDIWSLGCVVLEMYAGRRPWSNDEAIGAMYKLGNYRLAPPIPDDTKPYLSSCGQDFLNLCFTVEPSKRPTAGELLQHEFARVPKNFRFGDTNLAKAIKKSAPSDSGPKS